MVVNDNGIIITMSVEEYKEFRKIINPPKTKFE